MCRAIATATNTVAATVTVGSAPSQVAITPNGAYAYVTNRLSNTTSVIATATNTIVATIPGSYPNGVAITPDGKFTYVGTAGSNSVTGVATATNVTTIPVSSWPVVVAVTPDGNFAYVTNQLSNTVSVIATANNTVIATIPVGASPLWVAFTLTASTAASTSVTLSATPDPSEYGHPVTLTADLNPTSASRTVEFLDGTTILGHGILVSGRAQLTPACFPPAPVP